MNCNLQIMNNTEIESHITRKYTIKKRLGKGAYGIVWKAVDRKTLEVVALKKIFDAFRNSTDAQRTFREIMFLQAFADHRNIIRLRNVIRAENDKDIYLVFEFMDTDLHNVIKKGNILTEVHKQFIMYQLLAATKYIHSGNVIHRDYKPSNILLDEQCIVKVCDFGLARSLSQIAVDEQGDPNLTEYVATRWYRAPEILLACHKYTKGVDMWSLGCILGEMLAEKPLFPGASTLGQIEKIMASVDPPTKEDINSMHSTYGPSLLEKATKKARQPLDDLICSSLSSSSKTTPSFLKKALDLLHHLLQFNPNKRLTAENALKHKYVQRFHNTNEEHAIGRDILNPIPDDVQLTVDEYRSRLYDMVSKMKSERRLKLTEMDSSMHKSAKISGSQTLKNVSDQHNFEHTIENGQLKDYSSNNKVLESSLSKNVFPYNSNTKNNHPIKTQVKNYAPTSNSPKYENAHVAFDGHKNYSNNHRATASQKTNNVRIQTVIPPRYLPQHNLISHSWNQISKPLATTNFIRQLNNPVILRSDSITKKNSKSVLQNSSKKSYSNHEMQSLSIYSQTHGTINASELMVLQNTKNLN